LWRAVPSSKITRNMILKTSDLIGMTPRRRMKSGKIIKISDLKYPVMIKKGTLVNLLFETKGLSLSVTGKAITDGGYGEIISVMNIKSRKTLKGMIIGKNRLRVVAPRFDQIAHLSK
jgi:flagella basal body P-ring formation protein FlgA